MQSLYAFELKNLTVNSYLNSSLDLSISIYDIDLDVKLDEDGNYISMEDFISGWLNDQSAWGRPVSPFIMSDGSMLVSDDKYNVIYKVQYKG